MFVLTKLMTVFFSILTVHAIRKNRYPSVYDKLNQDLKNLGHMVRKILGMTRNVKEFEVDKQRFRLRFLELIKFSRLLRNRPYI